jgi:Fe2+ or Zn2+ uptake regulation protein
MNFADLIAADIRLVILRALSEDPDYSHNEAVIREILAAVGHRVSWDTVRTQLSWLAEQGLVHIENVGGLLVAKLTARGTDVASGAATCPGVKRPRPGA